MAFENLVHCTGHTKTVHWDYWRKKERHSLIWQGKHFHIFLYLYACVLFVTRVGTQCLMTSLLLAFFYRILFSRVMPLVIICCVCFQRICIPAFWHWNAFFFFPFLPDKSDVSSIYGYLRIRNSKRIRVFVPLKLLQSLSKISIATFLLGWNARMLTYGSFGAW